MVGYRSTRCANRQSGYGTLLSHGVQRMRRGSFTQHAKSTIALLSVLAVPQVSWAGAEDWSLRWTDNTMLPPVFRQAEIPRDDGSQATVFVADFDNGLTRRKGLLVYLDGSGAQSLFTVADGRTGVGMFGVLARVAAPHYHIAAVEKRGVTFGVGGRPGSGEGASTEYTTHATRGERIADVRLLLDTLIGEPKIDPHHVVLVGHSEGADVAAGVAAADPRVTHVAFLSGGGASQMFDLMVLTRRRMAQEGKSPDEIEEAIRRLEEDYRDIFAHPQSESKFFMGHAYRRWSDFFSQPAANDLLRTKAKLFLAHGTEDQSVPIESFDFLTVELLRSDKDNVVVRRYPGRGHGLRAPNRPENEPPMKDVFEEIISWALR